MKLRRSAWVIISIVLAAAVGAVYLAAAQNGSENRQTDSDRQPNTAVATVSDLEITVNGSGTLVPVEQAGLEFQEKGRLLELFVDIGDAVRAGDLLAYLQTDTSLVDVNKQIAAAELKLLQARIAYDQLFEDAELAAARALLDLEAAERLLADVLSQETEIAAAMQAVARASQDVEDAEMAFYILNSSADEDAVYTAYASLLFKEKTLNELKDEVETTEFKIRSTDDARMRESLRSRLLSLNSRLANAQLEYEAALAKYDSLLEEPDPVELSAREARLQTARLQLDHAQADLDSLLDGPAAGDVLNAQARLADAERIYQALIDGPDPAEIALAGAQVEATAAQLAVLKNKKSVIELRAPMDGMVTEILYEVDEYITGGTVLTLADVSQPYIEFSVDQSDGAGISIGDRVEVVFDALPSDIYTGKVVSLKPALQEVNRVMVFQGLVLLEIPGYRTGLPIGLQASVDVTTSGIQDAVLVPLQAVQSDENGNTFVYLYDGETAIPRQVSLGIFDAAYVEITEGLSAGDVIAIDQFEQLGSQQ